MKVPKHLKLHVATSVFVHKLVQLRLKLQNIHQYSKLTLGMSKPLQLHQTLASNLLQVGWSSLQQNCSLPCQENPRSSYQTILDPWKGENRADGSMRF